jgi:membrane protease YdiL (CAAX protease family)
MLEKPDIPDWNSCVAVKQQPLITSGLYHLKESLTRKEDIMSTIRTFIKRHPLLTFYAVVFLISWGGFLIAVGPTTGLEVVEIPPGAILSMVAGPIVAGILLTGLVHGRAGFREFRSRLFRWRVAARWYAVALLPAPLLVAAVLFTLSLASPVFLPGIVTTDDRVAYLLFNLAVGLAAGFLEEIGWTGFAVPALRRRYGVFATGLIVGVLWGAWHFLGNVAAAENTSGTLSLSFFLPLILFDLLVGSLVAFRVLMVWVYDRTGSLLVAMLMHVSLTASVRILNPLPNVGVPLFIYDLALAAALWVVVAAVAVANRGRLSQQPRHKGGHHEEH